MANSQRSRQFGLAALIAALHLAALEALLALRSPPAPVAQQPLPPLTIVTLPRLRELGPAPADASASTAPLAIPNLAPPPLPTLPQIAPAAPDPALAALGQYLKCRLPGEVQITEDKERCAQIMRTLPTGPLPPPTEEEKALARMFEHNQRALESPVFVPCLAGILTACLASIFGDAPFVATYGGGGDRKPDPPVATGMVGLPGLTPNPLKP